MSIFDPPIYEVVLRVGSRRVLTAPALAPKGATARRMGQLRAGPALAKIV